LVWDSAFALGSTNYSTNSRTSRKSHNTNVPFDVDVPIDRFGFDFNYVNLRGSAIKKMDKLRNLRASRLILIVQPSLSNDSILIE